MFPYVKVKNDKYMGVCVWFVRYKPRRGCGVAHEPIGINKPEAAVCGF